MSHFEGEYERTFETEVAGVRMPIHTVAGRGGSILEIECSRFQVGPDFGRSQSGTTRVNWRGGPLAGHRCQRHAGQARP